MNSLTILLQGVLGISLLSIALACGLPVRWLRFLAAPLPSSWIGRWLAPMVLAVAGFATLAGIVVPFAAFFASCLALGSVGLLALCARLAKSHWYWPMPVLLSAFAVAAALAQPLGLKVIAMPKADDLPFKPVPARVIKTYDEGLWFEAIAAGSDGTLYLSGNRGLDFSRSDYYHGAQGELIARRPDGSERTVFETPAGSTSGVIAIAPDGTLYLTSHGASPSIWRIAVNGNFEKVAELPNGAWPNGLDIGPDGQLYSPDSALGLIWRIDPATRHVERLLEDARLAARPFISLAPGANGLHFDKRDMYVTVSDRTTVLKYHLGESGRFSAPQIVATGIPGDDFAVGKDGSLFITTHPYNTLVRVTPGRMRTVIGTESQHIVGATDAAFGRNHDDTETLYVVTDGGALTGGPRTRGQLVALEPYSPE